MTGISDSSIFPLSHALLCLRENEHTLSLDDTLGTRGKGQEYSKPEQEGTGLVSVPKQLLPALETTHKMEAGLKIPEKHSYCF